MLDLEVQAILVFPQIQTAIDYVCFALSGSIQRIVIDLKMFVEVTSKKLRASCL